jgi:alpha-L-rhamnosidase
VRARGTAGSRFRLRFAEVLKPTGDLDTANLRRARATDTYVLSGDPDGETFEPRFTYHGFRYVELRGSDAKALSILSVEGIVAHSDLPITGTLHSSQPTIEKLWNATLWSQRSNFFGIPTDCPQRDERMGWMGDAQIFWDAAAFNMDIAAFTRRFMADVRAGQASSGEMPDTAPFWALGQNTPGWADAAVILPWTVWQRYGDTAVIQENWEAMDRWQRRLLAQNSDWVWRSGRGMDYGDWLSVDAKSLEDVTTPKELISTAYWAYSTTLMSQMARAIGNENDALRYSGLSGAIRAAFVKNFVSANGRVGNGSQTSAVLALRFDLLPAELRKAAATQLVSDISRRGNKLSTGFLGTSYILDALDQSGQSELITSLLLQNGYPSWGFMTVNDATTIWERWDGVKDGKVTGSLNHYALGAVCGFLFRRLAGIETDGVGFERVRIRPLVDKRLDQGGGRYESIMGKFSVDWQRDADGAFRLSVLLPANTRGEIHLPAAQSAKILESRRPIDARKDLRILSRNAEVIVLEAPAGEYQFSVQPA